VRPEASTSAELPVFKDFETALIIGMTNGARSDRQKRVTLSVILSSRASNPGIFEMIAEMWRTTLSLCSLAQLQFGGVKIQLTETLGWGKSS
jgi:hypothetical protein